MVRHRSVVRSAAVEPLGHADADGRLTEDTGQVFGGQSEANGGTPRRTGQATGRDRCCGPANPPEGLVMRTGQAT